MSNSDSGSVVAFPIADAGRHIRHVFVRDLMIEGRIGIHRHEKQAAQRLRINLDLSVNDRPPAADRIEHVVCYEDIVNTVRSIIDRGHVNLVETLAEDIASAILTDPDVCAIRVRIEKLDVLADVSSVGVEIERASP
ncbi:MAG: dihydroneopterin aldolase [Alphaproteobacteria bacterium]